ncbi:MAG: hypothetical protein HZA48_06150 [Planctomycetes bacterium]|nr:hypothetical protein [Planctomycetota bacterium]
MLKKKFILTLFFLFLCVFAANAEAAVKIREIRIGTGNKYFRAGYWCPLKAVIVSDSALQEKINLTVTIDNWSYIINAEAKPMSITETDCLVQIFSSTPRIFWSANGSTPVNYTNELTEIQPDEFLIGIEEGIFERFSGGFQKYAYKDKIRAFRFSFPELIDAGTWNSLEGVDAIFSTEETAAGMPKPRQEALRKWIITGGNFILTDLIPDENAFFGLKRHFAGNPSVNAQAYGLYRRNAWPTFIKDELLSKTLLYLLLAVALLMMLQPFISIAKANNLRRAISCMAIAVFAAAFSIFAYGRFNPEISAISKTSDFYAIDAKQGTMHWHSFAFCYSNNKDRDAFYFRPDAHFRPVFADTIACADNPMKIVYEITGVGFQMKAEDVFVPPGGSMLFVGENAGLIDGRIIIKQTKGMPEELKKMIIYNETGYDFRQCAATDKNWMIQIGHLKPGGSAEIRIEPGHSDRFDDYLNAIQDKVEKNRLKYVLKWQEDGRAVMIAKLKPITAPVDAKYFLEINASEDTCILKLQ